MKLKLGLIGLLILIMSLIFFTCSLKRKQWQIKKWQKSLNLQEHKRVFLQLYQPLNGFLLSQKARKKENAIEYTYGEIEFLPFIALLSLVDLDPGAVFYDLGSGIGKAIIACAMVYPAHQYVGIEILPELHQASCNQVSQLAMNERYIEHAKKINFILGNFLNIDLDKATVIFVNSTTLLGSAWEALCLRLNNLPRAHTIITTSKIITPNNLFNIFQTKVEMSWGIVEAYIHTRKA